MSATSRVRCTLRTTWLWKSLSVHTDHFASQIRVLEIRPNEPSGLSEARIPDITPFDTVDDEVSYRADDLPEQDFITALCRMVRLERFVWRHEQPPSDTVWTIIKVLAVREVQVDEYYEPPSESLTSILDSKIFPSIQRLVSIDFASAMLDGRTEEQVRLKALSQLLSNSPGLEVLNIKFSVFGPIDISDLLLHTDLPCLRQSTFIGTKCTSVAMNTFFIRHPSLVSLSIPSMMGGRRWEDITLPAGALPDLTHLNCTSYQAARLLAQPSDRPLFCLMGVEVHDSIALKDYFGGPEEVQLVPSPWKDEFLQRLHEHPRITHIGLYDNNGPDEVRTVATHTRHIKWFDAGSSSEGAEATTLEDWAFALAWFDDDLQTLHMHPCVDIGRPTTDIPAQDIDMIRFYAEACPNLRTFEHWKATLTIERVPDSTTIVWAGLSEEEPGEGEGVLLPSQSFVKATMRRLGGPSQPGPVSSDIFWHW